MGFEYVLDFDIRDPATVDERLRRVPGFENFDPVLGLYAFRRTPGDAMPDVFAKIEEKGVYLCDNGRGGAVVEEIHACLSDLAGGVELREL